MYTFYEHSRVTVNDRHAEMIRAAEHARLVRAVRQHQKRQPNRFVRTMRTLPQVVVNMAQRFQHRDTHQASGHAQ